MEFKAESNPRISLTLDGRAEITFTTKRGAVYAIEDLKNKELLVKVMPYSPKRSLSQNAYMWVLIGELSAKLHIGKDDIYKAYIRDYGSYEVLPIKADAVDRFIEVWSDRGLGWVCDKLDRPSKLNGYVNVMAFYGSSSYGSAEMSRLIDAVIEDCKEQGINTLELSEVMKLKNENDRG